MARNRKALLAVAATAGIAIPTAIAGVAYAHGYTDSPESRQYLCSTGEVSDCGAIEHEPQSVEGPKGFPEAGHGSGRLQTGSGCDRSVGVVGVVGQHLTPLPEFGFNFFTSVFCHEKKKVVF